MQASEPQQRPPADHFALVDPLAIALQPESLQASHARVVIESRLRDAIRAGKLKPGTRIKQESLAKVFSVSRMPVREALRQLESQGYLTGALNKGYTVAPACIGWATLLRPLSEQYAHLSGAQERAAFEDEVLRLIRADTPATRPLSQARPL